MRLQRFVSRKQNNCIFELAEENNDGQNYFTVLVGENGVGKSRLLRDIFDTVFNSVIDNSLFDSLGVVEDSTGRATLLPHPSDGFSWPPPHIIALSGVATDRFPVKRSLATRSRSRFDSHKYLYCGPKSENGMVSRNLSERQLYVELLRNTPRLSERTSALESAFELFPTAREIIFRADRTFRSATEHPRNLAELERRVDAYIQGRGQEKPALFESDAGFSNELDQLRGSPELMDLCLRILVKQDGYSVRLLRNGTLVCPFTGLELLALRLLTTMRFLRMQGVLLLSKSEEMLLDNLSSGQWQVLSSILLVAVSVEPDALILIDEPENSLHPAWQQTYLPTLTKALASVKGVHVIVATHSPLIAASIHPDVGSVCAVKRTLSGRVHAELLGRTTYGWSSDDILQEVFELDSSRSIDFRRDLDDALHLVGKGDIRSKKLREILTRLNGATASLPEMDTVREVVATINALAGGTQ